MIGEYLERYEKAFGDRFPMYQLGRGRDDAEIISIIESCLKANKDVYQLVLLEDDDEVY